MVEVLFGGRQRSLQVIYCDSDFFLSLSFLVISLRNGHIKLHEIVELFTYTKRNRFSIRSMILLVYEFTIIHHTFIH